MIRSTKHSLKYANVGKLKSLRDFVTEYRRLFNIIYQDLIERPTNFRHPSYKPYVLMTCFSARMLQRICDHVSETIYTYRKSSLYNSEAKPPNLDNINPNLNRNVIDFKSNAYCFDQFLRIKINRSHHICLPIKHHKQSIYWASKGTLLNSVEITNKSIILKWEVIISPSLVTKKIGIDQGINKVLTLSDGQITPKVDKHNHSLHSIIDKLSRRKKGSKRFKQAQEQRKNFINWSINQLNFNNIGIIGLEKISGFKPKTRPLSHWSYGLIKRKIMSKAQELGVLVIEQESAFRSQRCNQCGYVHKFNRQGEKFVCGACGHQSDSDLNAAKNHEQNLPKIKIGDLKTNHYWYQIDQEFIVPDEQKTGRSQ